MVGYHDPLTQPECPDAAAGVAKEWVAKRLKAIRFGLINVAGRVVNRSRQMFLRLSASHPFADLLIKMRGRILALAQSP